MFEIIASRTPDGFIGCGCMPVKDKDVGGLARGIW